MAPPYMTVNEFGAYLMLFIYGFAVAIFTAAMILGEDTDLPFIGLYSVLIFMFVLSIIMVLVQEFR